MSELVLKIENGEPQGYPILMSNLKSMGLNTDRSSLRAAGYAVFFPSSDPDPNPFFRVEEVREFDPASNSVTQTYNYIKKSADEIDRDQAAQYVRLERDRLLAQFDWMVSRNAMTGEPIPQKVLDYCEALRNITDHPNFPILQPSDWPVHPTPLPATVEE